MSNFGGNMQMIGNDLSQAQTDPESGQEYESVLKTETWPLPIIFRIGLAIDLMGSNESFFQNPENRITLAVDGNHPNDNNETIGLGVEYEWNNTLALRSGYKHNHDVENLSFGAGLKFRVSGLLINIDYAYADFGDLENVQRFTAGISF